MRVSADPSSPHFVAPPPGYRWNVTVDGRRLLGCIEADDVEGWATCVVRDADGRLMRASTHPGRVLTTRHRGVVTLRIMPLLEEKAP